VSSLQPLSLFKNFQSRGSLFATFFEANTESYDRNRNGLNDWIHEKYQKEQAAVKSEGAKAKS
jgi:hypothetical protein